jgi:hypothetical protein
MEGQALYRRLMTESEGEGGGSILERLLGEFWSAYSGRGLVTMGTQTDTG